mmetsp:Transcript_104965/g.273980  ORF Transcript_104965/g.273980 Transcript_104965/m.273980 type:complete len:339 (+) Transcript_104965:675-1691(+)
MGLHPGDLRSDVVWRAGRLLKHGALLGAAARREAEVAQLHRRRAGVQGHLLQRPLQQDILGLDVAVHHAVRVAYRHGGQHLADHVARRLLAEGEARPRLTADAFRHRYGVEEVAPAAHVHDHTDSLHAVEAAVQTDDAGVAGERCVQGGLALQAAGRVAQQLGQRELAQAVSVHHLGGELVAVAAADAGVDLAEGALADPAPQRVLVLQPRRLGLLAVAHCEEKHRVLPGRGWRRVAAAAGRRQRGHLLGSSVVGVVGRPVARVSAAGGSIAGVGGGRRGGGRRAPRFPALLGGGGGRGPPGPPPPPAALMLESGPGAAGRQSAPSAGVRASEVLARA